MDMHIAQTTEFPQAVLPARDSALLDVAKNPAQIMMNQSGIRSAHVEPPLSCVPGNLPAGRKNILFNNTNAPLMSDVAQLAALRPSVSGKLPKRVSVWPVAVRVIAKMTQELLIT